MTSLQILFAVFLIVAILGAMWFSELSKGREV